MHPINDEKNLFATTLRIPTVSLKKKTDLKNKTPENFSKAKFEKIRSFILSHCKNFVDLGVYIYHIYYLYSQKP